MFGRSQNLRIWSTEVNIWQSGWTNILDQNDINSIGIEEEKKYSFSNQHEYFWLKWQYFNWNYEAFDFLSAPSTKQSPPRSYVLYTQCVLLWLMLYFGCVWLDLVVFGPICSVVSGDNLCFFLVSCQCCTLVVIGVRCSVIQVVWMCTHPCHIISNYQILHQMFLGIDNLPKIPNIFYRSVLDEESFLKF